VTARVPARVAALRARLLAWFDREKRRLPWRGTRDPYRVWISEIMLQQTTVEAVRRRYDGFLRRFPDLAALARAREDSVLAAWSGLGYYARARNLRRAARAVLARHAGALPRDPQALRQLPGLGDYTAAAIAALAFGQKIPAAEANVTRVVSRLFALGGRVSGRQRRAVLERVDLLLPEDRPGDFLAALMDLGQLVCTPRRPACGLCPLSRGCRALRRGVPEAFPERRPRQQPIRVAVAAAFIERGGRALLFRRRPGLLAGMWEFPAGAPSVAGCAAARAGLTRRLAALGLLRESNAVADIRHTVVNRRLEVEVFRGRGAPVRVRASGGRWFSPRELERAAIPTLTRKIARAVGFL